MARPGTEIAGLPAKNRNLHFRVRFFCIFSLLPGWRCSPPFSLRCADPAFHRPGGLLLPFSIVEKRRQCNGGETGHGRLTSIHAKIRSSACAASISSYQKMSLMQFLGAGFQAIENPGPVRVRTLLAGAAWFARPLRPRWRRAALFAHQAMELAGLEMLSGRGDVGVLAIGMVVLVRGQPFNGLPQQCNLLVLRAGVVNQAAQRLA